MDHLSICFEVFEYAPIAENRSFVLFIVKIYKQNLIVHSEITGFATWTEDGKLLTKIQSDNVIKKKNNLQLMSGGFLNRY